MYSVLAIDTHLAERINLPSEALSLVYLVINGIRIKLTTGWRVENKNELTEGIVYVF